MPLNNSTIMEKKNHMAGVFMVFLILFVLASTLIVWIQNPTTLKIWLTSIVWLIISFVFALVKQININKEVELPDKEVENTEHPIKPKCRISNYEKKR